MLWINGVHRISQFRCCYSSCLKRILKLSVFKFIPSIGAILTNKLCKFIIDFYQCKRKLDINLRTYMKWNQATLSWNWLFFSTHVYVIHNVVEHFCPYSVFFCNFHVISFLDLGMLQLHVRKCYITRIHIAKSLNLNRILQRNFKSQDINICSSRVISYTCDVLNPSVEFR